MASSRFTPASALSRVLCVLLRGGRYLFGAILSKLALMVIFIACNKIAGNWVNWLLLNGYGYQLPGPDKKWMMYDIAHTILVSTTWPKLWNDKVLLLQITFSIKCDISRSWNLLWFICARVWDNKSSVFRANFVWNEITVEQGMLAVNIYIILNIYDRKREVCYIIIAVDNWIQGLVTVNH